MNVYQIWCNLKPGVRDHEFMTELTRYLEKLKADGKLEHFREAVEGSTSASNLVMRGGLKLAKGSMTDAVKNAKSMNFIMRNWWGVVPTDWDV